MDVPGEESRRATVKRRVNNADGTSGGTHHQNPLMDTREYALGYDDGTHDRYFANVIEENLYSQIDSEGRQIIVLEEITDHRKDRTAIEVADGYTVSHNGNKQLKKITRGWEINIKMKEGLSQWIPLKEFEKEQFGRANRVCSGKQD